MSVSLEFGHFLGLQAVPEGLNDRCLFRRARYSSLNLNTEVRGLVLGLIVVRDPERYAKRVQIRADVHAHSGELLRLANSGVPAKTPEIDRRFGWLRVGYGLRQPRGR